MSFRSSNGKIVDKILTPYWKIFWTRVNKGGKSLALFKIKSMLTAMTYLLNASMSLKLNWSELANKVILQIKDDLFLQDSLANYPNLPKSLC